MVKQILRCKLILVGDGYGPTTAKFKYRTIDDGVTARGSLTVSNPNFDIQDLEAFYDGYMDVIKSNESIS